MTQPTIHTLGIWLTNQHAGTLSIDRGGAMHFTYSESWLSDPELPPLSQAMPKTHDPFGDRVCKAVFGGLLPEEGQRTAIARALGISPDNPFRLLEALGGDVAGALAFLPDGQQPVEPKMLEPPVALSDEELESLLERLPRVPMLAGEGGARLSLAGAQSKLPIVLTSQGSIAIPRPGEPSTHLIKPEPDRFAGLAANEEFCLALARAIGLDAVQSEWREIGGRPLLLVTRYDRHIFQNGPRKEETLRLHQEDFAQALAVPSHRKYAAEGGPTFRDSFELLRRAATRPAREVLKLADAAIFNLVIGNADAHAKNYSLLRKQSGELVLAPLYDLVATNMWDELSPRLAMRFGRASNLDEIDDNSFASFAEEAGLAAPYVKRRAQALARSIQTAIERGVDVAGLSNGDTTSALAEATLERAARLEMK